MIAPSHGVIWTERIADILRCYNEWGSGIQDGSLVIAYDSMWGGTEKLARAIARGVYATSARPGDLQPCWQGANPA